ncbi:MAG: hypothetical protein HY810_09965 [Candidatus Omnitrophica bacterium]|nr:hypothetical protein [Candidatus Omnitrophota bacterium]
MNNLIKKSKFTKEAVVLSLLLFFLYSCAVLPKNIIQVDNLVIQTQYESALSLLEADKNAYGKNNELLYLLDLGLIQHFSGKYKQSIDTFDKAKLKYEELYTESLSKVAATWLVNDYLQPYQGEDFERVFINIFQAFNYIMLGEFEDAIIEARDVDSKLTAINSQYSDDQKNVYKEDAFARFLMGICYEIGASKEDLNDAFISYAKASNIYDDDFAENYGVHCPDILKDNILTASRFMGLSEFSRFRDIYYNRHFISLAEKAKKAEIYLIQYNGISPAKFAQEFSIPTPDGNIIKVAFPEYRERPYAVNSSRVIAVDKQGRSIKTDTELVQDIGKIAIKNLERRKLRFIAKSIIRSSGRYLIEKKQKENIQKKEGNVQSGLFGFFSAVYNMVAEQADLRCWQTLPDQIRIGRILLDPGEYEIILENFNNSGAILNEMELAKKEISAGQKLFLLTHTAR